MYVCVYIYICISTAPELGGCPQRPGQLGMLYHIVSYRIKILLLLLIIIIIIIVIITVMYVHISLSLYIYIYIYMYIV